MCISLGYPDPKAERALLEGRDRRELLAALKPVTTPDELAQLSRQSQEVFCSPSLIDYVQSLVSHSRAAGAFAEGLSPRAAIAVLAAARAWAFLEKRDHVLPEDVKAILPSTAAHRMRGKSVDGKQATGRELVEELIRAVTVP
jgi:MoxR-like ATPase